MTTADRRVLISIRWVVTLVGIVLTAAAVLGVGAVGERSMRETLSTEIEMRIVLDARMLATASSSALLGDFPELTLHPLVRQMRVRQPELAAIVVVDRAGLIQGHEDARLLGTPYQPAPGLKKLLPHNSLEPGERLLGDGRTIVAACTVTPPNGKSIGTAYVGVRRDYLDRVLAAARRKQLVVLGIFLGAGIVVASLLMSQLLKPIGTLREGIERIGRGDLETPLLLRDRTELGLLGSAINRMASQLREAQERLVRKNWELRRANENLKEVDRLKSEFLRNVNHELRTPLTVIIAYLSYLHDRRDATLDEAMVRESVDVTLKESWKLKGLLEDVLAFAAVASDSLELSLAPGDLVAFLSTYHSERENRVENGKRKFLFEGSAGLPPVTYDPKRLAQVLDSLLDNAVKFTPEGTPITLRVGEDSTDASWVWVELQDEGPGIPPEKLPDLFASFRQGDGSTTREVGGLGLGLALTKELVERMGGTIAAQSRLGKGTTITLRFPAASKNLESDAA